MRKVSECEIGVAIQTPPPAKPPSHIGIDAGKTGLMTPLAANAPAQPAMPTAISPLSPLADQPLWPLLMRPRNEVMIHLGTQEAQGQGRALMAEMDRLSMPARPDEIALLVERLASHYPASPRDEVGDRMVAEDWMEDLAEFPADILKAACAQYRRSTARFMATPGQILALAEPILASRKIVTERFRSALVEACA